MLLRTYRDPQMMFAAVIRHFERQRLETLLTLKAEKALIWFGGCMKIRSFHKRTAVSFVLGNVNMK
jgi:hypothetical protein